MSKHTNGPWTAEVIVSDRGGWTTPVQMISIYAGSVLIAYYTTVTCEFPADDAENAANARLIAAAPELLDILAKALDFIDANSFGGSDTFELMDECRSVLAKATGESK